MQAARSAKGHEREVARIIAPLDRYRADRPHHVGCYDTQDAERCFMQPEIELPGNRLHDVGGSYLVQGHGSADESFRQATKNDIGIRHGRLRSAAQVTSRSRHRPRTHRADFQQSVRADKCDGAAPGANGVNIDRGKANGKIRDVAAVSHTRDAVLDQTDVRARAADIEGYQVALE